MTEISIIQGNRSLGLLGEFQALFKNWKKLLRLCSIVAVDQQKKSMIKCICKSSQKISLHAPVVFGI